MKRRFQRWLLRRRRQVQIAGDNSVQIQCGGTIIRPAIDEEAVRLLRDDHEAYFGTYQSPLNVFR